MNVSDSSQSRDMTERWRTLHGRVRALKRMNECAAWLLWVSPTWTTTPRHLQGAHGLFGKLIRRWTRWSPGGLGIRNRPKTERRERERKQKKKKKKKKVLAGRREDKERHVMVRGRQGEKRSQRSFPYNSTYTVCAGVGLLWKHTPPPYIPYTKVAMTTGPPR